MKITSMSNRELYKIMTGNDYPYGKNEKLVKLTETLSGQCVDVDNAKTADSDNFRVEKIRNSLSKITKTDRFESSKSFDLTQLSKNTSSDYFEHTGDIDFNDRYTNMVISSRSLMAICNGGSVPTKESIAKYYGDMAKRLDMAYSEGKFTKDEYEYLPKGIAERLEHAADCAEDTAAFFEVGHNRSMSLSSFEKRMSMTRDERKADLKAEINEYIEKYFKIDRTSLLAMFNAVRYGK